MTLYPVTKLKNQTIFIAAFLAILGALLAFDSALANADEASDQERTRLLEMRDSMRAIFPELTSRLLQNQVDTYFYMRAVDFVEAANGLSSLAKNGIAEIQEARTQIVDPVLAGGTIDSNAAVKLDYFRSVAKRMRAEGALLVADSRALSRLWTERCSPAALEYPISIYNPSRFLGVATDRITLRNTDWVVGVNAGFSYGPNTGVQGQSVGAGFGSGEAAYIAGAVGTAIGYYGGPLGSLVGGLLGSFIGAIFDNEGNFAKKSEQLELMNQIVSEQLATIRNQHAELPKLVAASCSRMLPETSAGVSSISLLPEVLENYAVQTERFESAIEAANAKVLAKYKQHLERLRDKGLRSLDASFSSSMAEYFSNEMTLVSQMLAFMKIPQSNIQGSFAEAAQKERLWNLAVEGDAMFNQSTSSFSFMEINLSKSNSGIELNPGDSIVGTRWRERLRETLLIETGSDL